MMHLKPVSVFEPHMTRNQCKLIWDSATHGPCHKLPGKKKVAFLRTQDQNVTGALGHNRHKRNSLVATRISFYEDRNEVETNQENSPESPDVQVKISFDDHATTTFEYEGEDSALESYLAEHPEEREEALKQEDGVNGVSDGPAVGTMNEGPSIPLEPETHMKSNTVIGTSGGGLVNYKSKILTQDFQFGMTSEPEVTSMPELENQEESESIDLLPADESELDAFSAELEKSDMLF